MDAVTSKRGDQFIRLLILDYEKLVLDIKDMIDYTNRMLTDYVHSESETEEKKHHLVLGLKDLQIYEEELNKLKGAENEEQLLLTVLADQSPRTESPKLQEITCTTVL